MPTSTPIVIKYGGSAMTEPAIRKEVATAIAQLAAAGKKPVVVHGGGPFIAAALERAQLTSHFVRGLRVTTPESLVVIEEVLTRLSKVLAQEIGVAIGLSGRDSSLLVADVKDPELGRVGEMRGVNAALIDTLMGQGITPVIACLAETPEGDDVLNVNADSVAGAVAGAMKAPAVFLSDVPGVLDDPNDKASLIRELSESEIQERIADGRIAGGMIPKVEAALAALKQGAAYAVIADGRRAESLAAAITKEAGTRITP